jgi:hypothetical protein
MFYLSGTKVVPSDLSLLTPLALAYWVMQDGSLGTAGGFYLCTDSFYAADTKQLAAYLHFFISLHYSYNFLF